VVGPRTGLQQGLVAMEHELNGTSDEVLGSGRSSCGRRKLGFLCCGRDSATGAHRDSAAGFNTGDNSGPSDHHNLNEADREGGTLLRTNRQGTPSGSHDQRRENLAGLGG
jgi:hypothetical protein